jgi:hypothetical protein
MAVSLHVGTSRVTLNVELVYHEGKGGNRLEIGMDQWRKERTQDEATKACAVVYVAAEPHR